MDLFGEISVTKQDIELWLDNINQLSATPSRRAAYAKAYNVEQKLKQQKETEIGHLKLKVKHFEDFVTYFNYSFEICCSRISNGNE